MEVDCIDWFQPKIPHITNPAARGAVKEDVSPAAIKPKPIKYVPKTPKTPVRPLAIS
jgi:hypothetical protein